MSYIDSNLIAGEKVIYRGSLSWAAHWALLILVTCFISIGLIGISSSNSGNGTGWIATAAAVLFLIWLEKKTTEIAITDKRIIAKVGFISRRTVELKIERIESMQVNQSIVGRMFGYGSLVISGSGNPQAPIKGIANPLEFRNQLAQLTDKF